MNYLLNVENLVKSFGSNTVVDDLSFHISPGECLGVIGPNGAGKTTTLRMCLGLTAPDAGSITYFENLSMPDEALAIKARLGVVAQMDTLDPDFTAEENLLVYGRYFGMKDRDIKSRIATLLEFGALTSKAKAKPGELSGGMKRRLSLARALINQPQMLMLDEPTTGLDPQARHLMWERLQMLMQEGKSILLTTHFMDEAERLCDRLLVIDHGKKIAEGKPRDLIAQHLEPDVVELYGQGALALADEDSPLRQHAARVEISGETAFFYTSQAQPLLMALQAWPQVRSLHRPANLEDLFLKLTGRQIRENWAPPQLSMRWWPVFLRNLLVWRKLALPSLVGNIAEPLMWLVAFGYGLGALVGEVTTGGQQVPYILFLASGSICMSAMNAASFEALYSAFSRMHMQKTWDGIMNAPVRLDDVVMAEMLWASFKALFTVTAILGVMLVLGISHSWKLLLAWPVLWMVGVTFSCIALIFNALAKGYDFFTYYFTLFLTPMMFLSGIYFPRTQLPGWLQTLTDYLPLTAAIELVRPLFLDQWPTHVASNLCLLIGVTVVAFWVALALTRQRFRA
ncbi:MAG: Daunorubicin/doxorubicin resistance ATP-binding protein DrrA [Pseudomonadota bacterium]